MTEKVFLESDQEVIPLSPELIKFYKDEVLAEFEDSAFWREIKVIDLPGDYEISRKSLGLKPLVPGQILDHFKVPREWGILNENFYLLLNNLIRKRSLIPEGSNLSPIVSFSEFGFTVVEGSGSRGFFVTIPFEVRSVVNPYFEEGK